MADRVWFWLSFTDGSLPVDEQFLGGCWVDVEPEAPAVARAVLRAHELGIDPGGEALVLGPVLDAALTEGVLPEYRRRLLAREEVLAHG